MESLPMVILDLDETLIHALNKDEMANMNKGDRDRLKQIPSYNMDDYYAIFERPYLQTFLDFLFKNFRVSVWTAASKDYALFIIKNIILQSKPERHIEWIFFAYHCDISKKIKKSIKDLSMLWGIYQIKDVNPSNTVIIDDNEEVFSANGEGNCISIKPFEILKPNSNRDNELKKMIPFLLSMKKNISQGSSSSDPAKYVNQKMRNVSPQKQ
jgi:TFIIF-interacting CTD phosphatase-like protein